MAFDVLLGKADDEMVGVVPDSVVDKVVVEECDVTVVVTTSFSSRGWVTNK